MANPKQVRSTDIELVDKLVTINRVTKVTKGGRTFSFSAIVVVGNENGVVGHGLGKAKEVTAAIAKAIDDAKKNLIKVPVIKGTIPHSQRAVSGSTWGRAFRFGQAVFQFGIGPWRASGIRRVGKIISESIGDADFPLW